MTPPAYKAEESFSTGVSHPTVGLSDNLLKGYFTTHARPSNEIRQVSTAVIILSEKERVRNSSY